MQGHLETIKRIRGEKTVYAEPMKGNRHVLLVHEREGEAAYCFSAPLRSKAEGGSAFGFFPTSDGGFRMEATDGNVKVKGDMLLFERPDSTVCVRLPHTCGWQEDGEALVGGDIRLTPTTGGVVVHKTLDAGEPFTFRVVPSDLSLGVRSNSKYFALMEEKYVPSFVIAGIGVFDRGAACHALSVSHVFEGTGYAVTVEGTEASRGELVFELNWYEHKLLQDTTVEANRPRENNAFGGVAFVGRSDTFGEQRLYLKLDYVMLNEFQNKKLKSARLYLTVLGGENRALEAFVMEKRFCSFGSTWKEKVGYGKRQLSVCIEDGLCGIDLGPVLIGRTGALKNSYGLLLRGTEGTQGCLAIATGDSYAYPAVLELRYEA